MKLYQEPVEVDIPTNVGWQRVYVGTLVPANAKYLLLMALGGEDTNELMSADAFKYKDNLEPNTYGQTVWSDPTGKMVTRMVELTDLKYFMHRGQNAYRSPQNPARIARTFILGYITDREAVFIQEADKSKPHLYVPPERYPPISFARGLMDSSELEATFGSVDMSQPIYFPHWDQFTEAHSFNSLPEGNAHGTFAPEGKLHIYAPSQSIGMGNVSTTLVSGAITLSVAEQHDRKVFDLLTYDYDNTYLEYPYLRLEGVLCSMSWVTLNPDEQSHSGISMPSGGWGGSVTNVERLATFGTHKAGSEDPLISKNIFAYGDKNIVVSEYIEYSKISDVGHIVTSYEPVYLVSTVALTLDPFVAKTIVATPPTYAGATLPAASYLLDAFFVVEPWVATPLDLTGIVIYLSGVGVTTLADSVGGEISTSELAPTTAAVELDTALSSRGAAVPRCLYVKNELLVPASGVSLFVEAIAIGSSPLLVAVGYTEKNGVEPTLPSEGVPPSLDFKAYTTKDNSLPLPTMQPDDIIPIWVLLDAAAGDKGLTISDYRLTIAQRK